MDKRIGIDEAVGQLRDGMTVGIGGWGARRKPMSLVRAICRSPVKDLTVVSYGGSDVGMLCAAGKVSKLIFAFVSLDVIPLDPHFRAIRESGEIEVVEYDEGMLQWGLYAAALKLPFLPTHVGRGTDVEKLTTDVATVRSPYEDGSELIAMPAIHLDVALVHANRADARGNAQVLGPDPYFDDLFCMAAERRILSCERVVPTEQLLDDSCIHTLHLNRAMVDAVVEAPLGAHPTSCVPDYGIDAEHLAEYAKASKNDGWVAYTKRFIDTGNVAYLDAVGGYDRVAERARTHL